MKRKTFEEIVTSSTSTMASSSSLTTTKERKLTIEEDIKIMTEKKRLSTILCQDFIEIIFSYLQPTDLLYTIPFVCVYWRNLLNKIENQIWKIHLPKELLNYINEDLNFINYKKIFKSLVGEELYFKELFLVKLKNLYNKLNNLQFNEDFEQEYLKILNEIKNKTKKEQELIIENKKYLIAIQENFNKNFNNFNEMTKKEQQLTFLQSTTIVKSSKPKIVENQTNPSHFYVDFSSEIIFIGINGNCSNKFKYEGYGTAFKFDEKINNRGIYVYLTYQSEEEDNSTTTNKNNGYNNNNNNNTGNNNDDDEELNEREEERNKLFIYQRDNGGSSKSNNPDKFEEILTELKEELGYSELTILDLFHELAMKIRRGGAYSLVSFSNCFRDRDVFIREKDLRDYEEDDEEDESEEDD